MAIRRLAITRVLGPFKTVVLKADTQEGSFTLWFSIRHDYALVQAERVVQDGDRRLGEPVPAGFT